MGGGHNSGNIPDDEPLVCIVPPLECLGNVIVCPPVVGNKSWNSDYFKIGSGNASADPGCDFIYEDPKPAPTSGSGTGAVGTWRWDSDRLYLCTATNVWQKIELQPFGSVPLSAPTYHYHDTSNNISGYEQLGTGNHVIIGGNCGGGGNISQTYSFRFPASPSLGNWVEIINFSNVRIKIDVVDQGSTRYIGTMGESDGSMGSGSTSNGNDIIKFDVNWRGGPYKIVYTDMSSTTRWLSTGGYIP